MSNDNLPEKVLIVDDDPTVPGGVKEPLAKYKIKVVDATSLDTALYQFNQQRFDVVCVELDFEYQPGLVLLQKWRNHEDEERRNCGVILLVGNRNERSPAEQRLMAELRDIECLVKPFTAIQLLPMLSRARAAKARAMKYLEVQSTAFKLGDKPEKLEKAVALVQKQLPQLGAKGMEMIVSLYEKHEKWDEALQVCEGLVKKEPQNGNYANMQGRILMKLGRHNEALACLEKADMAAPDNINRIHSMVDAYLAVNKPDEAAGKMKQMIDFHPEDPTMKFDMFAQLQNHGFDSHAQSLCKQTTSPIEVVRYYNNKGVALKNVGKVDEALQEYDRCLQFYPSYKENYRIFYNIALAHIGQKTQKGYKDSIEFLDKCLELKPDFDKALKMKGQVESALSKPKKKKKKPA